VGSLGEDLPPASTSSTSSDHETDGEASTGSTTLQTSTAESSTATNAETTTGGVSTTSSDSTDSTGTPSCPPLAEDDACTMCAKELCCEAIDACHADPACLCLNECHAGGTPLPECEATCGLDHGENAALELCIDGHCTPPCP
jgi:hypothetical protein